MKRFVELLVLLLSFSVTIFAESSIPGVTQYLFIDAFKSPDSIAYEYLVTCENLYDGDFSAGTLISDGQEIEINPRQFALSGNDYLPLFRLNYITNNSTVSGVVEMTFNSLSDDETGKIIQVEFKVLSRVFVQESEGAEYIQRSDKTKEEKFDVLSSKTQSYTIGDSSSPNYGNETVFCFDIYGRFSSNAIGADPESFIKSLGGIYNMPVSIKVSAT